MDADALFEEAEAALRANRVAEARGPVRPGRRGRAARRGGDPLQPHRQRRRLGGRHAAARRAGAERPALPPAGRARSERWTSRPPCVGEVMSEAPHLTLFPGLFTAEECRYLIEAAAPMLAPSVVVDPATGAQRPDPRAHLGQRGLHPAARKSGGARAQPAHRRGERDALGAGRAAAGAALPARRRVQAAFRRAFPASPTSASSP